MGRCWMRTGSLPRKIFSVPTRKRHRLCSRCAIPAKRGENHYKTSFAIFGFQLVQIETDVTGSRRISRLSRSTRTWSSGRSLTVPTSSSTAWWRVPCGPPGTIRRISPRTVPRESATLDRRCPDFFNTAAYLLDYAAFARKFEQDRLRLAGEGQEGRFPRSLRRAAWIPTWRP